MMTNLETYSAIIYIITKFKIRQNWSICKNVSASYKGKKDNKIDRQVNISFFDPSETEVLPPAEFDYSIKRKEKETKLNIRLNVTHEHT